MTTLPSEDRTPDANRPEEPAHRAMDRVLAEMGYVVRPLVPLSVWQRATQRLLDGFRP